MGVGKYGKEWLIIFSLEKNSILQRSFEKRVAAEIKRLI